MAINNESIGISAEVAIGRTFDVPISPDYELRAEERIVALLMKNNVVAKIFYRENILSRKYSCSYRAYCRKTKSHRFYFGR